MNNYTVYKHTTPNNKVYIGITLLSPNIRWANGRGYRNQYFNKAINKYSWDKIKHEIIADGLSKEEAEKMEIELIRVYKSNNSKYGYNITDGGISIGKHSEQTIEKLKIVNAGTSNGFYGKKHSESTRNKISVAMKGKRKTNEHKQKMKESNKVRNKKSIIQYDINGVELNRYTSISEASKVTNIPRSCIHYVLHGKRKLTYGYGWKFV